MVCLAGCYGGPQQFAGISGQTLAAEPSVRVTSGSAKSLKKGQSGEWMVRINRERGYDQDTTPAAKAPEVKTPEVKTPAAN